MIGKIGAGQIQYHPVSQREQREFDHRQGETRLQCGRAK
jgi:hypothetical protein